MTTDLPRYEPAAVPSRRRLSVAISAAGAFGLAAVLVTRADGPLPTATATTPPAPAATPDATVAAARARQQRGGPVEDLRRAADRYVDARRDALRYLDAARTAGADPRVVAAFAGLLGMPGAEAPAPETATAEPPADELSPDPPAPDHLQTPPRAL